MCDAQMQSMEGESAYEYHDFSPLPVGVTSRLLTEAPRPLAAFGAALPIYHRYKWLPALQIAISQRF